VPSLITSVERPPVSNLLNFLFGFVAVKDGLITNKREKIVEYSPRWRMHSKDFVVL
jgi:hypothetical protein